MELKIWEIRYDFGGSDIIREWYPSEAAALAEANKHSAEGMPEVLEKTIPVGDTVEFCKALNKMIGNTWMGME